MPKEYLNAAIDHGTCNSGIAVMDEDGPRVLKPNGVDDVMPSAVYIAKSGTTLVGDQARRAILLNDPKSGDGYTGYKINIGQNDKYTFHAASKTLSARELGGLVIGRLLQAYRDETGRDINSCVITVPAKFEHTGTDGTREAARRAGLAYCPLLMEPVAAAVAYGFSAAGANEKWLVFDLGAGTLDVSLVLVRDGEMIVPEGGQDGDNYLGGGKFDRELFGLVVEKLGHEFEIGGLFDKPENRSARGKLLLAVEEAKIRLSGRAEAHVEVEGVLLKDAKGRAVKVDVPVTRAEYESLIIKDLERAVQVCRNLLQRNKLTAGDVGRLILIGGPTKTPLVKQVLRDSLGIMLEDSIDPMTAVARGAAVFAAAQEVPEELRATTVAPGAPAGAVSLRVEYDRYSKLTTYCLVGTVEGPGVGQGGYEAEVKRSDGLWESGRVPVDTDGMFTCDLLLIEGDKPTLSQFKTTVYDPSGRAVAEAEEPAIWYPFPDVDIVGRVANSLRVGLAANRTTALIGQGAELPAKKRATFETTSTFVRGSDKAVLEVPVLEGVNNLLGVEDDHADCCALVGLLRIQGSDRRISRDLPEGTEIDITLRQDRSRQIHALAYIPLIDEEFEATFTSEGYKVSADEVADRLDGLKKQLDECEALQRSKPVPEAGSLLDTIRRLDVVATIDREIERARAGEVDSHHRAYKRTLELAGTVNRLRAIQRKARVSLTIDRLTPMAEGNEVRDLEACRNDLATADAGAVERIEETVGRIDDETRERPFMHLMLGLMAIDFKQPRVTVSQQRTHDEASALATRYVERGKDAMTREDVNEAQRMRERMAREFPELGQWVEELLRSGVLGGGGANPTMQNIVTLRERRG